ncbi:ATP-binding protein [Archangium lansingense]|uniref:ATP-binding protein n=1 Tax=Archangium lansingense TaxID=2995310 RepID=UPI003B7A3A71
MRNLDAPRAAAPLDAEWERIELLGHCLARMRQGIALEDAALGRLRELHERVRLGREAGAGWRELGVGPFSGLEYDVLACALVPEVEPRIGWLFQQLQPGSAQPYPSAALVQELFALEAREARQLAAALGEDAPLRRQGVVEMEGTWPYATLRPGRGLAARLLGLPEPEVAPPGSHRVRGRAPWEALVLPEDRLAQLREFMLWLQHRRTVVEEWGGSAVGGPVALFAGPSGTGKTFAALVLATELGWPLYRVDLGALVSKYIGETEKNLNRLFGSVHGRPMVLQFDEADSLFGRRGEVKEARDRYANLEVSHLLARIEQHEGPCILTTNLRGHLDPAFARRFQAVIEFPRPDERARARLWRTLLPPRAPREPEVDSERLGEAVPLTGGGIRNAALHAAYLAAGAQKAIGMREVALAVWRELGKDGRELSPADLGPLARFIPEVGRC